MFESFSGNTDTILLLGIVVFVFVSFLGLILWNSKTNKQVKALASIDDSLKHLEIPDPPPQTESQGAQASPEEAPASGETDVETQETEETEEPAAPEETAVARSGRIYTRQELEEQIRD